MAFTAPYAVIEGVFVVADSSPMRSELVRGTEGTTVLVHHLPRPTVDSTSAAPTGVGAADVQEGWLSVG